MSASVTSQKPREVVRARPPFSKYKELVTTIGRLVLGNIQHKNLVNRKEAEARRNKIARGEADAVVIACSDARLPVLDSDKTAVFVRVAGNVVSYKAVEKALSMLKKDGLVVVLGHCACGAVKEHNSWVAKGKGSTGVACMDKLLNAVKGASPEENVKEQVALLKEKHPSLAVVGAVYDWNSGKIKEVAGTPSALWEDLKAAWVRYHLTHTNPEELKSQTPHSIAIVPLDLPFSPHRIFSAGQNQIFTVSCEGKIGDCAMASILYAVEHLNTKHIILLAGESALLDQWEEQLRGLEVVITKALYKEDGGVELIRCVE